MGELWTPLSLSRLLTDNGLAPKLSERVWPLFEAAPVPPATGRPGEPERPEGDCLLWLGARLASGYGNLWTPSGTRPVHAITWTLANGMGLEDRCAAHRCEAKACANPDHVRPLTHQANIREGRLRRYPDWLLQMIPKSTCECGGPTTTSILLRKRVGQASRYRWRWTCGPCAAAYQRQRRAGEGPLPRTGIRNASMPPEAVAALKKFLAEEGRSA